jgi:thioredoxin-related protein
MPRMASVFSAVVIALLTAHSLQAQDVRWRHDYAAARKEATATGRLLLLDFGTEACMWCRKLDVTTFRDRSVVETINANFVPVKVDGDREERLTQALGVQAFPTLVLVSPEGKIVARQEGYADAFKMMAMLRQAPAREVREAPKAAAQPRSAAAELLTSARADFDAGRYLACIQKCDALATGSKPGAEADEARRLSWAIAGDPGRWKQVTAQLESDLAAAKRDLDAALKR